MSASRAWGAALWILFTICSWKRAEAARIDSAVVLGRSERVWSAVLAEERRTLISLPESYEKSQRRYPVLYVLDGEAQFVSAAVVAQNLAHNGLVPEMIVVGVTNTDRDRDLTPTLPYRRSNGQAMQGHADRFRQFLVQELQPWVGSHYRAQAYRTLLGHSDGALFGLDTLLQAPDSFDGYLLLSPSHGAAMVPTAAAAIRGLGAGHFVFLSSGDLEPNIRPATEQLARAVGSKPSVRWTYRTFAHENHRSSVMPALYEGLRAEFSGYFPDEVTAASVPELRKYYAELSRKLGVELAVPTAAYANLARVTKEQVVVDEAWIADYPYSGEAYFEYGDALERAGRIESAHQAWSRGVELATADEDPYGATVDYRKKLASAGAARAQAVLKEFTPGEAAPGCAVGVMREGRWLFRSASGLAQLSPAASNSPDNVFGIASITKQFTAAAVAIAAAEHKLSLDEDVRKYIPELPAYSKPITLRNLLQHTDGLRDDGVLVDLSGGRHRYDTQQDLIRLFARQRGVNFPAGSQYRYGNTGYVIAAEVLERTTRKTLGQYAREKIFKPLGMEHTFYVSDPAPPGVVSGPYSKSDGTWIETSRPDPRHQAAGGLMTTLQDYAAWSRNLIAPQSQLSGGVELTRMLMDPTHLPDGRSVEYGFGLELQPYHGLKMVSHGGSGDGYKAQVLTFPRQQLFVGAFCNDGIYADALALRVADVYLNLPAEAAQSPATFSQADLKGFVGTYRERELRLPAHVTLALHGLTIGFDTDHSKEFVQIEPLRFRSTDDTTVRFIKDRQGQINGLQQEGADAYASGAFERIEPAVPANLQEYTGNFYSADLDVTYRFAVREGKLESWIVPDEKDLYSVYEPMRADEFVSLPNRLTLRFERDGEHRVSGLLLTAQHGWVTDMRFERVKP